MSRYDDLTRPATVPPDGTPPGLRVAYISVTLPAGVADAARATPGRSIAGRLGGPDRPGRPVLVAFGWVKIEDGGGLGFRISDLRLMRDGRGFFLNYPQEVREAKCRCGGTNKPKARFCNWCGVSLEAGEPAGYHDLIFPLNKPSHELVLAAMVAAYEDALAEARGTPNPPRPAAGGWPQPTAAAVRSKI